MELHRAVAGARQLCNGRTVPWKAARTDSKTINSFKAQQSRRITTSRVLKPSNAHNRLPKTNAAFQKASAGFHILYKREPQTWSHRMYKKADGKPIMVHYCRSLGDTEKVAQLFLNEPVLGYDMEWKAQATASDSIQNNVSLIQLASRERIALFQISLFFPGKTLEDLVSPTLKRIIEDPETTKVGVNIKADFTRLRKFMGIEARGVFELSHLYKLVKYCHSNPKLINKRVVRLEDQVLEHFGLPLSKDSEVRCSDWSRILTYSQVHYAAADAYAGFQLFHTMDVKRKALKPTPPLPAHAELNIPISTVSASDLASSVDDRDIEAVVGAEEPEKCTTCI
ncbi:ribonuclease H-like domain-containing protein [Aspergillus egyptiacus]|nr:ribonuclease H-like domain-containing protein [Aspergillus egyptiacus]